MITQKRLKEVLEYNPETGVFTWTHEQSVKKKGQVAGCLQEHGYIRIRVKNEKHRAHRLAFLYMTGEFPTEHVDHINHDKSDNRWSNLRQASNSENMQNVLSARSDNTSGYLGVSFNKEKNKFVSVITVDGTKHHLGYFDSANDAGSAYMSAKQKLHPFSTLRVA
jgi:hypothetical protein